MNFTFLFFSPIVILRCSMANDNPAFSTERVQAATKLLSKAFETNPCITYVLNSMTKEKRLAYLPAYFDVLLTVGAMNHGTFEEIDNWGSCAVMMPPGYRVDNPFTLMQSGFLPMLWNCGIGGCSVY